MCQKGYIFGICPLQSYPEVGDFDNISQQILMQFGILGSEYNIYLIAKTNC